MKANTKTEKFKSQLETMRIYFEELAAKKQGYFDSKSEKWQESDKGDEIQQDITSLEDIASDIERLNDGIETTFENE